MWRDIVVSFLPSKKLESSLAGELTCGSSAGGRGTKKLLPLLGELLKFNFRLRNMAVRRRTRGQRNLREGGYGLMIVQVLSVHTLIREQIGG